MLVKDQLVQRAHDFNIILDDVAIVSHPHTTDCAAAQTVRLLRLSFVPPLDGDQFW